MQKSGHRHECRNGNKKRHFVTDVISKLPCLQNAAMMSGVKDLRIRTKEFALRIMKLYRSLPAGEECRVPGKQLLRYFRGRKLPGRRRARSKGEFVPKMEIFSRKPMRLLLAELLEGGLMSEDKL
jgi:hypothetical protein